jgi:hypothetical protein
MLPLFINVFHPEAIELVLVLAPSVTPLVTWRVLLIPRMLPACPEVLLE